jgi:hypothetical protein
MARSNLVFLGGTCGNNIWRPGFIEALVALGVPAESLFDPVVEHWDEAAQRNEEEKKAAATHMLFYIADPKFEGVGISAYSLVEATMALYDRPDSTVVVFDLTGITLKHVIKAMNQACNVLKKRFPEANIFATQQEAIDWLARELASS